MGVLAPTCLQSHLQTFPPTPDKACTNLLMPGRLDQGWFGTVKGTCLKCQLTIHTLHFDQKNRRQDIGWDKG